LSEVAFAAHSRPIVRIPASRRNPSHGNLIRNDRGGNSLRTRRGKEHVFAQTFANFGPFRVQVRNRVCYIGIFGFADPEPVLFVIQVRRWKADTEFLVEKVAVAAEFALCCARGVIPENKAGRSNRFRLPRRSTGHQSSLMPNCTRGPIAGRRRTSSEPFSKPFLTKTTPSSPTTESGHRSSEELRRSQHQVACPHVRHASRRKRHRAQIA